MWTVEVRRRSQTVSKVDGIQKARQAVLLPSEDLFETEVDAQKGTELEKKPNEVKP